MGYRSFDLGGQVGREKPGNVQEARRAYGKFLADFTVALEKKCRVSILSSSDQNCCMTLLDR